MGLRPVVGARGARVLRIIGAVLLIVAAALALVGIGLPTVSALLGKAVSLPPVLLGLGVLLTVAVGLWLRAAPVIDPADDDGSARPPH